MPNVQITTVASEEAKEFSHPMSHKLGSRSLSNYSRDFWSFCKIPVVAWRKVGLNVLWSKVLRERMCKLKAKLEHKHYFSSS